MPAMAISITVPSFNITVAALMAIMIIRTTTVLPFFTSLAVLPFFTSFTVFPMVAVTFPVTPIPVLVPTPFSISTMVSVTLPILVLVSSSVPLSRFRGPSLVWLYLLGTAVVVGVVGEPGGLGRRGWG